MKSKLWVRGVPFLVGAMGYTLLAYADWRVLVGVLLINVSWMLEREVRF